MFFWLRGQRRRIGLASAFAILFTAALTCFLQADGLAPELPCCAAMGTCSSTSMASNHDCCRTEPSRAEQQLLGQTHVVLPKPTPPVVMLSEVGPDSSSATVQQ